MENPIQMDDLGIFRVPPCQEMYAEGTLELVAIYDHTLSNLSDIGSLLQRAWSKQHVKSGLSMPKPCFKTHRNHGGLLMFAGRLYGITKL